MDTQKDYLQSGKEEDLKGLSQRELAKDLGVNVSTVNRLMWGRSLILPWGEESPSPLFARKEKMLLLKNNEFIKRIGSGR